LSISSDVEVSPLPGDFVAVKLYNTGVDGWRLEELSVQMPAFTGPKLLWQYDQWLDADGIGASEPAADIFYASDALTLGENRAASLVVLETSSLEDSQTDDTVTVALQFTDGTATEYVEASADGNYVTYSRDV
jgi:hypothetical protein